MLAPTFGAAGDATQAIAALLPELKFTIGLVTAACIITGLYFGRDVLVPLALAIFLGFVLDPLVVKLRRLGLPRTPAVIVVAIATLAVIALSATFLATQIATLSARLPTYQSNIADKLKSLRENVDRPGMFEGAFKTLEIVRREINVVVAAPRPAAAASQAPGDLPPRRVLIEETPQSVIEQAADWLKLGSGPLATTGIVMVFVVLILLDRLDLRDRMLRLWGGSLQRSTDAMDEAGARISKYLIMQLVVNASFGLPFALGLWLIGVPGALLWGVAAVITRFVPYVGPMLSSVFPLVLAFAIDPGWGMVLWTIGLICALQFISSYFIAPWLYGASTGLSAISLMTSAIFWTAMWGPVGLVMSTPLTVCLLVIGRYLPRLQFLDVLLGSQPALDTQTRIYQRLLAGDVEEATELAHDQTAGGKVTAFYDQVGMPVLRMASHDHAIASTTQHRHRVVIGMNALIDDVSEQHPSTASSGQLMAICLGAKWEVDSLAARMLAHALSLEGIPAAHRPAATVSADYVGRLDIKGAKVILLSYFSGDPRIAARQFCRRLRRRWPDAQIILGLWNAPADLLGEDACKDLGADAVVTSVNEAVVRIVALTGARLAGGYEPAQVLPDDGARVQALRASGALDARAIPLFDAASKRAADIFDVPLAMVSLIDHDRQIIGSARGPLTNAGPGGSAALSGDDLSMPRSLSMCGHVVANSQTMVVPDVARDLRFAGNPALAAKGVRFYAGAPLRSASGHLLGSLCLLDLQPRMMTDREVKLLEAMADDLVESLRQHSADWGASVPQGDVQLPASAIVGQPIAMG
ncbi:phytochrome sensor protein [Pseudorhodoferax sp. Leaf274]|nr:phytochrome sensor protein [Pseudorhodoferax sp. Leaf274]